MADLPADITYGYALGRYLIAIGDTGNDLNTVPDGIAAVGSVRIAPLQAQRVSMLDVPTTIVTQAIICLVDSDGWIIDPAGGRGVWLVAGRYSATFSLTGVTLLAFTFEVTTEHTLAAPLNLTLAAPLTPGTTQVFVVNQQVYLDTQAARDDAATAAATATEKAAIVAAAQATTAGQVNMVLLDKTSDASKQLSATFVATTVLKPWAGKTIYLFGDSISSTDYTAYGTTLAAKTGATVIVGGHSGATINALTSTAWLDATIATAPDLIILMTAGNDQGVSGTVGTFGSASGESLKVDPDPTVAYAGTTFIEAAAYIVRYLNSKRYLTGTKLLYLNGLPQNRSDHSVTNAWNNPLNHQRKADAVAEVCTRYHISMLDTMRLCGWDTSIEPFWPGVTDKTTIYGVYTMDGLHPNPTGYDRLTDAVAGFVNASIKPLIIALSAPPRIIGLTAGKPTSAAVPLTWSSALRATSYLVESQLGSGSWSSVATVTGTSTTATRLTGSSSYNFRVTGINSAGSGTASAVISATPLATPITPRR